jgi:hypothetical protein
MNILFNEIKQFIVKQVDQIEYYFNDKMDNSFVRGFIFLDKLQPGKKYLIIELSDDKKIVEIIFLGEFINFDYKANEYKFTHGKYYNNYYNSLNYKNVYNTTLNNTPKKEYYDIKSTDINLDGHIELEDYESDPESESEGDSFNWDFIFYELEQGFNIYKFLEIVQFCIDNQLHIDKENCLCIKIKNKLGFKIFMIDQEIDEIEKTYVEKVEDHITNLLDKKKNFKIYCKL